MQLCSRTGSNPHILPHKRLQVEPGRARHVTTHVAEYAGCCPFSSVKVQGMRIFVVCLFLWSQFSLLKSFGKFLGNFSIEVPILHQNSFVILTECTYHDFNDYVQCQYVCYSLYHSIGDYVLFNMKCLWCIVWFQNISKYIEPFGLFSCCKSCKNWNWAFIRFV